VPARRERRRTACALNRSLMPPRSLPDLGYYDTAGGSAIVAVRLMLDERRSRVAARWRISLEHACNNQYSAHPARLGSLLPACPVPSASRRIPDPEHQKQLCDLPVRDINSHVLQGCESRGYTPGTLNQCKVFSLAISRMNLAVPDSCESPVYSPGPRVEAPRAM